MKRGSSLLATLLLLLGTVGLLVGAGNVMPQERQQALGAKMLESQLGAVAELVPQEAPEASAAPTAETEAPVSRELVPVTTVAEAWDETARETETETVSPVPVTVDGGISLELRNETDYEIDIPSLPALPAVALPDGGEPVVLIMHTHGSESYTDPEISGYRTQDETKSVIAVGETIAAVLEARGYGVLHDKTLCDYPEYTGAYNRSREVIQAALAEHPQIALVLDVHRDAVEDTNGEQMRMACTLEGQETAQLMLVVGTDAGGLPHPDWQMNLSLAAVLQTRLSTAYPGLMRPLNLRRERFNQDLAPMDLLIEVGASGNSLEEAQRAATAFAEALSDVLDACCGKSS